MLTTGATPLLLLDYVAAAEIHLDEVAELVEGAAEVCRAAGVALVGGETAELPGIYRDGELDFAGTCVGVVDRDELVDGSHRRARRRRDRLPVRRRARERLHARSPRARDEDYDGARPARADPALPRRGARAAAAARRRSRTSPAAASSATSRASSRTGCAPSSTGTPGSGRRCSTGSRGHVDEDELRRVFNLGIGWCAVVAEPAPGETVIGRDRVIGVLVCGQRHEPAGADRRRPAGRRRRRRTARDAFALERARAAGLADRDVRASTATPTAPSATSLMATWLEEHGVELVVLAGYMHLLTKPFLDRFPGRIVNVHPSLLPEFPGAHAIEDALAAGVETTGVTVHYVDEGVDTGPIIRQERGAGRAARDARGAHPRGRAPPAAGSRRRAASRPGRSTR